jgi:hypothetical protein
MIATPICLGSFYDPPALALRFRPPVGKGNTLHISIGWRGPFIPFAPAPDRLIAHDHAAFEEQLLDVTKTELNPEIPTHGTADDCSRKAMTVIKRFCILHRSILRDHPGNVTMPLRRFSTTTIGRMRREWQT